MSMTVYDYNKINLNKLRLILRAESKGFEPLIPCGMPPFQDGALDHYANSPIEAEASYQIFYFANSLATKLFKPRTETPASST